MSSRNYLTGRGRKEEKAGGVERGGELAGYVCMVPAQWRLNRPLFAPPTRGSCNWGSWLLLVFDQPHRRSSTLSYYRSPSSESWGPAARPRVTGHAAQPEQPPRSILHQSESSNKPRSVWVERSQIQTRPRPTTDVSKCCALCRKSPDLAAGQRCAQALLPNRKARVVQVSTDREASYR